MATVTVSRVTFGWPESAEDDPVWATIDMSVDTEYVRMQYVSTDLNNAAAVQSKLTNDSAILLNETKQKSEPFDPPAEGTDRPDLVPSPFTI